MTKFIKCRVRYCNLGYCKNTMIYDCFWDSHVSDHFFAIECEVCRVPLRPHNEAFHKRKHVEDRIFPRRVFGPWTRLKIYRALNSFLHQDGSFREYAETSSKVYQVELVKSSFNIRFLGITLAEILKDKKKKLFLTSFLFSFNKLTEKWLPILCLEIIFSYVDKISLFY